MVRAWLFDNCDGDLKQPHMTDPPQFVDMSALKDTIGLEYLKIDVDNFRTCKVLDEFKKNRGYTCEDTVTINEDSPKKTLDIFLREHIHADDGLRLTLDGSGYFDVRNAEDKWVRIELAKGDMITLPSGMYHRFTLDTKNYIKANRCFIGEAKATPHNRPCEEHPSRQNYVAAHNVQVYSGRFEKD